MPIVGFVGISMGGDLEGYPPQVQGSILRGTKMGREFSKVYYFLLALSGGIGYTLGSGLVVFTFLEVLRC